MNQIGLLLLLLFLLLLLLLKRCFLTGEVI